MKLTKKLWLITIGIIVLFIILNPGMRQFKEYCGSNSYLGLKRESNFLVCSIYSSNYGGGSNDRYFAIACNFFPFKRNNSNESYRVVDSTKVVMDTTFMRPDTTTVNLPILKQDNNIPTYEEVMGLPPKRKHKRIKQKDIN